MPIQLLYRESGSELPCPLMLNNLSREKLFPPRLTFIDYSVQGSSNLPIRLA